MAKRRDRYVISGNVSANGKSLTGLVVVDLGISNYTGSTKDSEGKKLYKRDLTHRKFKLENPKNGKDLGLPKSLWEFTLLPQHVSIFLTKQSEGDK